MIKTEIIQRRLETATRRWWFFVGLIALQVVIPPYASRNFDFSKWGDIILYTLKHSFFFACKPAFPVFQLAAMAAVAWLLIQRNKAGNLFSMYAGVSYVLFAAVQNIAVAPKYGVSVATINVIMFLLVAAAWFWEAVARQSDFSVLDRAFWRYVIIAPAVLAFWLPIRWGTGRPDFNPVYFLTSGSALAFCTMTPVFIAVLLFFYPHINILTLRVTSAIGVIVGLYNVIPKLILQPSVMWWDGVLHLPLLVLSLVGVILSLMRTRPEGHAEVEHDAPRFDGVGHRTQI